MRLSIIVPARNEAARIIPCLEALQPLRQRGHEVIVVDGGSSDDTVRLARPMAHKVIVTLPGRATQLNAGTGHSRGDVLVFVHADTLVPPQADELVLANLGSAHAWGRFDVRLDDPAPVFRVIEAAMNLRSALTGIATGDQAMFVTRTLFDQVGGFAAIPLMEDIELSGRLRKLAWPASVPGPVVTSSRRWREHGVLRTILLMWSLRLRFALGADPLLLAREYD